MTPHRFITSEIRAGVWHGELPKSISEDLKVDVTYQGVPLADATCTLDSNRDVWQIGVPIPAKLINEGLQTFVVSDTNGDVLTQFSVLAGAALADDLRAEIALLRAELDILKTAFRKHCADS